MQATMSATKFSVTYHTKYPDIQITKATERVICK